MTTMIVPVNVVSLLFWSLSFVLAILVPFIKPATCFKLNNLLPSALFTQVAYTKRLQKKNFFLKITNLSCKHVEIGLVGLPLDLFGLMGANMRGNSAETY